MKFEFKIALRYLFAKKSYNAINIVSGVSSAAVGVVTAAMVCVLSVMNGFGGLIEDMFSAFDPDLRIEATNGKYFSCDSSSFDMVRNMDAVEVFARTIEETALIEFSDKQIPVKLKGVDSTYHLLNQIDSILVDGKFVVYDGAFERCVMGQGVASQLSIGAHFVKGIHLYAPRRNHKVNLLRPEDSFKEAVCFISGIFAVHQVKYDNQLSLISLPLAHHLFEYGEDEVTAIEIKLKEGSSVKKVKREIQSALGEQFLVLDKYEQQADFFRIMRIEKVLTYILLSFILLIATFNIIGSLTMLILDKQEDIKILHGMGANKQMIRRIFLFEGWLISSLGACIGLVVGVLVCLSQEYFGWLKLGNGSEFIISAYPIDLQAFDLLSIALIVLTIGWIAAWYPTHKMNIK